METKVGIFIFSLGWRMPRGGEAKSRSRGLAPAEHPFLTSSPTHPEQMVWLHLLDQIQSWKKISLGPDIVVYISNASTQEASVIHSKFRITLGVFMEKIKIIAQCRKEFLIF